MSEAVPRPHRGRLVQLDMLRGVAVVMILLNHLPQGYDGGLLRQLTWPVTSLFWTGVDLFFVLSGYLVGGLLIRELGTTGRVDVGRFLLRRCLKIWPGYYAYLAVLFVLTTAFYVDHTLPGAIQAGLLVNSVKLVYLQNYFPSSKLPYTTTALGNHTWTLAVEEHFYLLLPLLLVVAGRRWRAVVPAVGLGLMVGCLALRLWAYDRPMDWVWDYQVTHKRIDSLFCGVLVAYVSHERPGLIAWLSRRRWLAALLGLALVSPMAVIPLGTPFVKTFGYTCLAVGYSLILVAVVTTTPGRGVGGRFLASRTGRALAWVGLWSYSIYLWHMDLSYLFEAVGGRVARAEPTAVLVGGVRWGPTTDALDAAYLAAAVLVGAAMAWCVEQPILRWRDRRFPSLSAAAGDTDPSRGAGR